MRRRNHGAPRKTPLRALAVLALIVALSVLAAEGVARLALWRPAPEADVGTIRYGYTPDGLGDYHPHQDGVYVIAAAHRARPFHVQVNGDGLRNRQEVRADGFRILALGDSQTYGLFANAQDVWTDWLEHDLRRQGREVQVLNNGLPGASITEELEYFSQKGRQLQPGLVVLCVFANDVGDMARNESSREAGLNVERSVRFSALRWFLGHQSALYVAARTIRDRLATRGTLERNQAVMAALPAGPGAGAGATDATADARLEERYADGFRRLHQEVTRAEARLFVAFLPSPGVPEANEQARQLLRRLTSELGVAYLDLGDSLGQHPADEVYLIRAGDPGYDSDAHLSRFGHIKVAAAIAEALGGGDLIPAPLTR